MPQINALTTDVLIRCIQGDVYICCTQERKWNDKQNEGRRAKYRNKGEDRHDEGQHGPSHNTATGHTETRLKRLV